MKTIKLKTNIKCMGCIAAVTPHLNQTAGENNWAVDLNDPDRILTVKTDREESEIIAAVKKAGFEVETV